MHLLPIFYERFDLSIPIHNYELIHVLRTYLVQCHDLTKKYGLETDLFICILYSDTNTELNYFRMNNRFEKNHTFSLYEFQAASHLKYSRVYLNHK